MDHINQAASSIRLAKSIVVLSGAGMSQESGLPTFRDMDGLWNEYSLEEVATAQALLRDPKKVWDWHTALLQRFESVQPNAGHTALAALEKQAIVTVVTQNIDDLHEKAGSTNVIHLHGNAFAYRCAKCGCPMQLPSVAMEWSRQRSKVRCALCNGHIRHDVALFDEVLDERRLQLAEGAIEGADVVLVIGTSNLIYPAAALPKLAIELGKFVVEINPQKTPFSELVSVRIASTAAAALPALVRNLRMDGNT